MGGAGESGVVTDVFGAGVAAAGVLAVLAAVAGVLALVGRAGTAVADA